MKRILTILLSFALIVISSSFVKADESFIILGNNNKDILSAEELNILNEDLKNIQNEFDFSFTFVYDSEISDDKIIEKSNEYLNRSISLYGAVLCVNDNYYTFALSSSLEDVMREREEYLWEKYAESGTYYDGIINCYQEALKIVNNNFYESGALRVDGTPLIYDDAGLLTYDELNSIREKLSYVSNKYNMDVIILLADSLNGMTARNFADDYYDYNGYKDDGILFMLSMNEREWYCSTKGRAIEIISDGTIDNVVDSIFDYLSGGSYYKALSKYADEIDNAINYGINNNGADYKEKDISVNLVISAAIASIVTLVVYIVLRGQLRSVKTNKFANDYIVRDSFVLTGYSDYFLRKDISKSPRQTSSSSGSSGSHSSHTSSSGSSHGGHGGRF